MRLLEPADPALNDLLGGAQQRFARIEIIGGIAVVLLEAHNWSGKLIGSNAAASDIFTLLKIGGEWKIKRHRLVSRGTRVQTG